MEIELPIPDEHNVFEYEIDIVQNDIDELGHVNNVVYLRWVQLVASVHWNSKGLKTTSDKYLWVVLRHEIDYLKPALLQDKIKAKTWVSTMEGIKSVRIVEFMNEECTIARARTVWCLLDATTMRPKRIGDDIKNIFS